MKRRFKQFGKPSHAGFFGVKRSLSSPLLFKTSSSGEWSVFSINKTSKLDDNNNVEYVVCSAEDITARKKTELQLEKSKEKYEKLAEEAPVGILTCDNAGFVDHISDRMLP